MYDRILFPTDGSDGASAVLDHVLDLAEAHGATVHVLTVADTTQDSVTLVEGEVVDVLEREGERIVDAAAERAAERGVATVTEVLQGGVAATIVGYAAEYAVDLVAMPTRGRTGVERLLLGSTTERVVRQSNVPVLTIRPDDGPVQYPYGDVLVPTDGSDAATAALHRAVDLVEVAGATLHVLSVVDVTSLGLDVHSQLQVDVLEEQAEEAVEAAAGVAADAGVASVLEAIEHGSSVHRTIRSYVEDNDVDLVVMGTHGRTGLDRPLLGSVAERTVRTAPAAVMTVPGPASVE